MNEFYLAQTMIQRCAYCPEWTFVGPAREGVAAHRSHREQVHPEIKPRAKRRVPHLAHFRQQSMSNDDWRMVNRERRRRAFQNGVDLSE
jgi:hypothetical protein